MKVFRAPYRPPGGVHPAYRKEPTQAQSIRDLLPPKILRILLAQHAGAPARATVKKGDTVFCGQPIGEPTGFLSAAVHASACGVVRGIVEVIGPTGTASPAVEIETDGREERWTGLGTHADWPSQPPQALVELVLTAGIVGLGGAGFPTHVKLSPPPNKPIDTLIINGAECEPYLTADHRLMVEEPEHIVGGARILRHILRAPSLRVAVEDNKPDAIRALEKALSDVEGDVALVILPTAYPQGAEKQQIFAITGREVPSGGLPMDVGCLVENVATTCAVWDAVVRGRPLISRVTTVSGAVRSPGNWRVPIGTSYADLVAACGGATAPVGKIIAGGPMMGLAQPGVEAVITKTTSGVLLLPSSDVFQFRSLPCIGCGRCVDACPMRLMPGELSQMLEAGDAEAAEAYGVTDCIECGCCAYVCPAHRPLVQHMKHGKARVTARRKAVAVASASKSNAPPTPP